MRENTQLLALAAELRKQKGLCRDIARHLSKPKRRAVAVDLWKISKVAQEHEHVAVPGKVLSSGELAKPVHVYAWQFSSAAREKITKAGGKALPLTELLAAKAKARLLV